MKGKILDFSIQTSTGLISREDSKRYTFSGSEWKEANPPVRGQEVDFDLDAQGQAVGVYAALSSARPASNPFRTVPSQGQPFESKAESEYQPIDWLIKCLKNYANFAGRSRRKEFWFFRLAYLACVMMATGIGMVLGIGDLLVVPVILGLCVPDLAVTARRLHDTGRSGWWTLLALLPLLGILLLIFWWVQDSQPEANAYGAIPK